jgi:hypothetical protein
MDNRKRWMLISVFTVSLMMVLGLSLPSEGLAQTKENQALDIAILIDTSGSTRMPSKVDVNGNGKIGRTRFFYFNWSLAPKITKDFFTDPGDNILAAEALAAKRLIARLDSRTTRVAIISFAGDHLPGTGYSGKRTFLANPDTPDATVEQPLTHDFRMATDILNKIEERWPDGGTNLAEGIRVATCELRILLGSVSEPRPDARKFILVLTDGVPTFPEGSASKSDPEDTKLAVSAAELAGYLGITIHMFGLGQYAMENSETLEQFTNVTGGKFVYVQKPGKIIDVLPAFDITSPGSQK